jgi:hypothetical protein
MRARNHQRRVPGHESGRAIAAQAVSQQDGVEPLERGAVHGLLQAFAHGSGAQVVPALGEELDIHLVRRPRDYGAHFAVENFAGNQFQPHRRKVRFARLLLHRD